MKNCIKILNLDNLQHNVIEIKKLISPKTKLCAVVKSDAYGHNAQKICTFLKDKVDYFAFSNNAEAIVIKKLFKTPCLIIGAFSEEDLKTALKLNIIISVENLEQVKILNHYAKSLNKIAKYHLKIDSGMHRLGITTQQDFNHFLKETAKLSNSKLVGIFSHFGSGETFICPRTEKQAISFLEITQNSPPSIIKHLCNSTNLLTHNHYSLDMVRTGISLYGYSDPRFKPVMQIKAKILAINEISKGEFIGYGNAHQAKSNLKVATIGIGYAQGLPRLWGENGFVLVNGKQAKFVANICMDMSIIDITNLNVNIGDYVTILDTTPILNAEIIANSCGTISYEILTNFKNIEVSAINEQIKN